MRIVNHNQLDLMRFQTSRLIRALMAGSVCFAVTSLRADDWPQWRGPHRNGVSQETGLLKEWPKEGPKIRWQLHDLGGGYSTPAVVGDRFYLMVSEGKDSESVQAFAVKDGARVWSTRLGKVGNPDQQPNFPAARSTPTVDGDMIYALSSDGDLACLELSSGKLRWQKNLRTGSGGKPGTWAYSESPLIDGNLLVCTPGGAEATVEAFDKKTGEIVWKSPAPGGDEAGYASAIVVEVGGVKQYIQLLQKGLVGIDAKSGKFLWRFDKPVSKYGANIPTPVADESYVYSAAAGTGGGLVNLKAKDGTIEPEPLYFTSKLPTAIGGAIKVGDCLYGTTAQALMCVEFTTGNVKWEDRALGAASICWAEGRAYLHGENGEVALVETTPDGYREKGRFTPPGQPAHPNQMENAWAYPVVANGSLYVRDLSSLWCYDIAAK